MMFYVIVTGMRARELCHSWKRQGRTRRPEQNTSRIKVSEMGDCLESSKNIFCAQAAEAVKKVIRNSLCLNDHNDVMIYIYNIYTYTVSVKAANV